MFQRGNVLRVYACQITVDERSESHSEDVEMEEQVERETVGWCRRRRSASLMRIAITEEHYDEQGGKLLEKSPFVRQY